MSDTKRPMLHWPSAVSTRIKSTCPMNQVPLSLAGRKKPHRPLTHHPPTFSNRLAKTQQNIEELCKLYYSNNFKFDTFQQQIIRGQRIPNLQTSLLTSDQPETKRCVSPESTATNDAPDSKTNVLTQKRTVQVRIINHPSNDASNSLLSPKSPPPPPSAVTSTMLNSNVILPERPSASRPNDFNESSLIRSIHFVDDHSIDSLDNMSVPNNNKSDPVKPRQSSKSAATVLHQRPPSTTTQLSSRRVDPINVSYASFPHENLCQQINETPMITGTAVPVRRRLPTKSGVPRYRAKSSTTSSLSHSSPVRSSISVHQSDRSESPVYIGTQRIVSIPSKCSRYVLVTFPDVPKRYNAPTYVERLLLPERFPTLFQNIVHSYEPHRNMK